ncbi:hypothetical protein [Levilactobacillus brevis]|uniref:hypothetical protein n=1 Tax=Levilactobacillus brevis TaxID=1580 RepID=UPI001BAB1992|nr:hypothetical protein [Levilactobacillus brevis]MBS0977495.1 hypothetical protein [Levilactobacillus brevis]
MAEKLSEARLRANKKWDENNKERKKYIVKRSTAKGFIRDYATLEDILFLRQLLDERESLLKGSN